MIIEYAQSQPVFVFAESAEVFTHVQKKLNLDGIECKQLSHSDDIVKARGISKENTNGVYFFAREFARGVDLRLDDEAIVIVQNHMWNLTLSEVHQMVGRANRT